MDEYRTLIIDDGPTVQEYAKAMTDEDRARVREVWGCVIHFTRAHKGPFWHTKDKSDQKTKMLDLACELFPHGPPMEGQGWIRFCKEQALKLAAFSEYLFARSAPTPLSSFLKFAHNIIL